MDELLATSRKYPENVESRRRRESRVGRKAKVELYRWQVVMALMETLIMQSLRGETRRKAVVNWNDENANTSHVTYSTKGGGARE